MPSAGPKALRDCVTKVKSLAGARLSLIQTWVCLMLLGPANVLGVLKDGEKVGGVCQASNPGAKNQEGIQ